MTYKEAYEKLLVFPGDLDLNHGTATVTLPIEWFELAEKAFEKKIPRQVIKADRMYCPECGCEADWITYEGKLKMMPCCSGCGQTLMDETTEINFTDAPVERECVNGCCEIDWESD